MESDGASPRRRRERVAALCRGLKRATSGADGLPSCLALGAPVLAFVRGELDRGEEGLEVDRDQELLVDLELLGAAFDSVLHLRIDGPAPEAGQKVDLRPIARRNGGLRTLELVRMPLAALTGLSRHAPYLQALVLSACSDVGPGGGALAKDCARGSLQSVVQWEGLTFLSLRRSNLTHFDRVLVSSMPQLKKLDLSFNALELLDGLDRLILLDRLDLSYNRLPRLPALPKSSTLTVLRFSFNYVTSLQGVEEASCGGLKELEFAHNLIHDHRAMAPLSVMPNLVRLKVAGNPFTANSNYRSRTLVWVSRRVDTTAFFLDNKKLTGGEVKLPGLAGLVPRDDLEARSPVPPASADASGKRPGPDDHQDPGSGPPSAAMTTEETSSIVSSVSSKRKKKRPRAREATIGEAEHVATEEADRARLLAKPTDEPTEEGDSEHLETKRQIENLREAFGEDDWLRGRAAHMVNEALGIETEKPVIPQLVLDMHDAQERQERTAKFVDESSAFNQEATPSKSAELMKHDDDENGSVPGVEALTESCASIDTKSDGDMVSSFYRKEDEDESKGDVKLIPVWVDGDEQQRILRLDGDMVQEELETGMVVKHWFLHGLEVCEVSAKSDGWSSVTLEFSGNNSGRDKRNFVMSADDAQFIEDIAKPILEALARHALRLGALQCVKCQTEFTHEGNLGEGTYSCPNCKSSMVIALEKTPMPMNVRVADQMEGKEQTAEEALDEQASSVQSAGEHIFRANLKEFSTPQKDANQDTEDKADSEGTSKESMGSRRSLFRSEMLQRKEEAQKLQQENDSPQPLSFGASPEPQTAGSETPTIVQRSESSSDISVLSNPSQSSIEVLPRQPSSSKDEEEDQSVYDSSMTTTTDTIKEEETQPAEPTDHVSKKMIESSSSGSMAESIVTTKEVPVRQSEDPEATILADLASSKKEDAPEEAHEDGVEVAEDVLSSLDCDDSPATSHRRVKTLQKQSSESNGNVSTDDTESFRTAVSELSLNLFSANTTLHNTDSGEVTPSGEGASTPKASDQPGKGRAMFSSGLRQMAAPMNLIKASISSPFSGVTEGAKLPDYAEDRLALAESVMEWDFEDFGNADHRLKLYCELSLCDEADETVLMTTKAWVVIRSTGKGFLMVVVISNKRVHLLRVLKAETEEPEEWLCKMEAHCHRVSAITRLHRLVGGQGVGIEISATGSDKAPEMLSLVFGDVKRSDDFSSHLTQVILENVSAGSPVQSVDRTEEKAAKLIAHMNEEGTCQLAPYEKLQQLTLAYLLPNGRSPIRVSVVLTQATCILTSDYFLWAAKKGAAKPLSIKRTFLVKEVTQVDVFDVNPCRLRLTVNGDVDTAIVLQFQTESALLETMTSLRTAWENQRQMNIEEIVVFNLEKEGQSLRLRQIRLDDSTDPATFAASDWIQIIKRSLSPTQKSD